MSLGLFDCGFRRSRCVLVNSYLWDFGNCDQFLKITFAAVTHVVSQIYEFESALFHVSIIADKTPICV
jgi:hypothetical protein